VSVADNINKINELLIENALLILKHPEDMGLRIEERSLIAHKKELWQKLEQEG
jgi:hypothetical protein